MGFFALELTLSRARVLMWILTRNIWHTVLVQGRAKAALVASRA